jgi:hypothetical protein
MGRSYSPIAAALSSLFVIEDDKEFIGRGDGIRFITDIKRQYGETIREHLDVGMEVRYLTSTRGSLFSMREFV